MLRLAFDFIITWRETRTRPNAYKYLYYIHMCGPIYIYVCNKGIFPFSSIG